MEFYLDRIRFGRSDFTYLEKFLGIAHGPSVR